MTRATGAVYSAVNQVEEEILAARQAFSEGPKAAIALVTPSSPRRSRLSKNSPSPKSPFTAIPNSSKHPRKRGREQASGLLIRRQDLKSEARQSFQHLYVFRTRTNLGRSHSQSKRTRSPSFTRTRIPAPDRLKRTETYAVPSPAPLFQYMWARFEACTSQMRGRKKAT